MNGRRFASPGDRCESRSGTGASSAMMRDPLGAIAALQRYQLVGEIARGGMGIVYRAHDLQLDRPVAIKVILAGPETSPLALERFLREAHVVARLNHPGIVSVYDFGRGDGLIYLVLELVEGGPLNELVAASGGRLAWPDAVRTLRLVLDAVGYAHGQGVVHRDLKPQNILVDRDGRIRVIDFGLVRQLDDEGGGAQLTQPGRCIGTPHYMSPEQFQPAHDVDARSDVYALGAVLYECLTGRPPIYEASLVEQVNAVLKGAPPPPPSAHGALVPPALDAIILKAIAKDREQRWASAAELSAALAELADAAPSGAGWTTPVPAPATSPAPDEASGSSTRLRAQRSSGRHRAPSSSARHRAIGSSARHRAIGSSARHRRVSGRHRVPSGRIKRTDPLRPAAADPDELDAAATRADRQLATTILAAAAPVVLLLVLIIVLVGSGDPAPEAATDDAGAGAGRRVAAALAAAGSGRPENGAGDDDDSGETPRPDAGPDDDAAGSETGGAGGATSGPTASDDQPAPPETAEGSGGAAPEVSTEPPDRAAPPEPTGPASGERLASLVAVDLPRAISDGDGDRAEDLLRLLVASVAAPEAPPALRGAPGLWANVIRAVMRRTANEPSRPLDEALLGLIGGDLPAARHVLARASLVADDPGSGELRADWTLAVAWMVAATSDELRAGTLGSSGEDGIDDIDDVLRADLAASRWPEAAALASAIGAARLESRLAPASIEAVAALTRAIDARARGDLEAAFAPARPGAGGQIEAIEAIGVPALTVHARLLHAAERLDAGEADAANAHVAAAVASAGADEKLTATTKPSAAAAAALAACRRIAIEGDPSKGVLPAASEKALDGFVPDARLGPLRALVKARAALLRPCAGMAKLDLVAWIDEIKTAIAGLDAHDEEAFGDATARALAETCRERLRARGSAAAKGHVVIDLDDPAIGAALGAPAATYAFVPGKGLARKGEDADLAAVAAVKPFPLTLPKAVRVIALAGEAGGERAPYLSFGYPGTAQGAIPGGGYVVLLGRRFAHVRGGPTKAVLETVAAAEAKTNPSVPSLTQLSKGIRGEVVARLAIGEGASADTQASLEIGGRQVRLRGLHVLGAPSKILVAASGDLVLTRIAVTVPRPKRPN